jgi:arabinose-5-phosphate isomerase
LANASSDIDIGRSVLKLEADALMLQADGLGEEFVRAVDAIFGVRGRVICAGIGKSGHVARKIAATLSSTGTASYFVHPTEASHGDLGMIQTSDVLIALSRSGETAELDDLVQYSRRFSVTLVAMTAVRDSALGRAADIVLAIPNAPEACEETRAPTTSTTLMMALGDALAVAVLRRRGFDAGNFKILHPGGKLGAMLKTAADLMHKESEMPLIASGAALNDGLEEISAKKFGCVGVVDATGALAGVITDGDVRRMVARRDTPTRVDDAMTRSPVTVEQSTLAASVLQLMNERKVTQVFVAEAGKPVGIIHLHDLLRAGLY